MNPDIPVAIGEPIFPLSAPSNKAEGAPSAPVMDLNPPRPDLRTATALNGGRSSRILLPLQSNTRGQALSEAQLATLQDQGYTKGLAAAMARNQLSFPLSIWILDNSGSTATQDGHRLVELPAGRGRPQSFKMVSCTRWAELQQTVEYHVQRAALLRQPTVFRLLNDPGGAVGPQQFSIAAHNNDNVDHEVAVAQSTVLNAAPSGVTPLVPHIREIRRNVLDMQTELRANGTKVAIIIATDGLPSDEQGITNEVTKRDFVNALQSLVGLPVWIVVRLCTDDDSVVAFWNNLDDQVELDLEVLDDFGGEAAEVQAHNPWLTYGLPLHRMREAGFYSKLFDLLDEQSLDKDQVGGFVQLLLGAHDMPDPQADWDLFCDAVERAVAAEPRVFNPLSQKVEPWINVKALRRQFGRKWLGIW